MPMVKLLEVVQRTEDGKILINHVLPNPLMALDLITEIQKTLIHQAVQVMELKAEAKLITGENGKALVT
jgi:hypothetical protein